MTFDVANFGALAAPYGFAQARAGVFTEPNLGFFQISNASEIGAGGAGSAGTYEPPSNTNYTLGQGCYDPVTHVGDYICFDSAVAGPLYGADPTGVPPFNAFSVRQDFKTPRYHNFNLAIQSELFRNNVLTLTYSGQRGRKLLIYHDLNASPLGSPCTRDVDCDPFRPYTSTFPDLRHVIAATNLGSSQYDSLQASYNQRSWHGLDTQYNLTWSKCFDLNSVNRGGQGDYPQLNNPLDLKDNRGLCDHDRTLNFNVGGVYSWPTIRVLGNRLGGGWQLSTIYTALSGKPFSVFKNGGSDPSGQGLRGTSIRDNYDGSQIIYHTRNPDSYVEIVPGQFTVPDPGTVGNSRRNMLRGPGLSQWDMSLIKNTKINERLSFQLRWEVYNILNRANFALASLDNTGTSAQFGTLTQTPDVASGNPVIAQGGPRNMNFALKFIF